MMWTFNYYFVDYKMINVYMTWIMMTWYFSATIKWLEKDMGAFMVGVP